jgi:regulator of protease activity HflC (stomatin/prohibitin superfamily)
MTNSSKPSGPFFKRMLKNVGGAFGWRWLGGRDIAFVLRDDKFYKLVKGPGWLFLVPGLDTLAFTIDALPDSLKELFENVQTHDGLLVSIELKIEYLFDPFQLGLPTHEHARVAKRSQNASERRTVAQDQAQRALLEVISAFPSQVICAGGPKMWQALEQPLWKVLNDKLRPFGMLLVSERCSVQAIIPPERVKQQMELSAERLMSAMMLRDLTLSEQAQVLRAEAISALKTMTGGSPYMNLHDFAVSGDQNSNIQPSLPQQDPLASLEQLPRQAPVQSAQQPPPRVIDGSARPVNKDDPTKPAAQKPPPRRDDEEDEDVRSMLE